ncbi:LOW QUALITY PROTEIN: hypothetical protein BRADI_3g12883v3 [Brachypodium distachyon]|uniref:Uncharacterized protein n=1 Tax=Brachypodium distachyon TaxID=15368 RepID=A0A2K2CWS0_BRADI|nr:LOW QUALITY PROTEIN: hypothetical protein BRADI_3g12883v3 [Brachypodium distachyon]
MARTVATPRPSSPVLLRRVTVQSPGITTSLISSGFFFNSGGKRPRPCELALERLRLSDAELRAISLSQAPPSPWNISSPSLPASSSLPATASLPSTTRSGHPPARPTPPSDSQRAPVPLPLGSVPRKPCAAAGELFPRASCSPFSVHGGRGPAQAEPAQWDGKERTRRVAVSARERSAPGWRSAAATRGNLPRITHDDNAGAISR